MKTNPLAKQLDLGPKSASLLRSAGIHALEQLRGEGAVAAYMQVKRLNGKASLNLLYALVGTLEGCDWCTVQHDRKLELLMAIEDFWKSNG